MKVDVIEHNSQDTKV